MILRFPPALKAIVLGGVVAGAFDMTYALVFYGMRGVPAARVLQTVASGLLGQASYSGGLASAALGLLLHFLIAIAAAATFFVASRRFTWLVQHAFVSGAIFGLCVYVVMNFIVLPLSAFPHKLAFPPIVLATGLFVHIFLVGVPIALFTRAASLRTTA
jgi:uncharacterized membrane protein YagU involved in acid resistance